MASSLDLISNGRLDAGGQPKTSLSVMAIAGPFLSFIGIIILIIGGIFLLKDRIRRTRGSGNIK